MINTLKIHVCLGTHHTEIPYVIEKTYKGGMVMSGSAGCYSGGFALLVVLFILLIIVGASWGYGY
jgi:uncharacterized protein (TIGR01732 family)